MPANHHPEGTYFEGDYLYTEGIEDASFEFGADRVFPSATPTLPAAGSVKVRRGTPSQADILFFSAAGVGLQPNDVIFTIWAETLGNDRWKPKSGDILEIVRAGTAPDPLTILERWIIRTCRTAVYGTQYVCLCSESPLNQDTVR